MPTLYCVAAEFHIEGVQDPRLSYLGELVIAKHNHCFNAEAEVRVSERNWPRLVWDTQGRLQDEYGRVVFVRFQVVPR